MSSAASRVVQLLLLGALTHLVVGPEGDAAIVAFVLLGSIAQLTDSGGLAYLLVNHQAAKDARALFKVVAIQTATVGLGLVVGLVLAVTVIGLSTPLVLGTVAALGLASLVDGIARVLRSGLLIEHRPLDFAAPEIVSTIGRLVVIGGAWWIGSVSLLALSVVPAVAALIMSIVLVRRISTATGPHTVVRVREVLAFGISGLSTIFLSQSPLIVASLFLPAAVAAPLSVAYRVAQAAEFVPATFAQQILPTLVKDASRWVRFALIFFALGVFAAVVIWIARDLIGVVIDFPPGSEAILGLLLLSLPFRFANHLLVSLTFARGLAMPKAWLSLALGILATVLSAWLCVSVGGVTPVAIAAAALEPVQTAALLTLLYAAGRRLPRRR